ncbi:uncharacterized protein LOC111023509 [Momordica charantia]|uniref:Uncharacterized protein LOC111023509 n=1 Tax=Momordica charantia TaxID=3673 RepID=A0A6J1DQY6_MOMCH|nr:uncharacterized protein LOC111023509 [Momordica charantia]
MRKEYGVNLSYDRAWRSSEEALRLIRADPTSSYGLLPAYGEALKIMYPSTIFELELEGGKYFKYVFMTLGQSIRGFLDYIRPVLVVDEAHLKWKFGGVLLSASGVDANNHIYPIAFAIVDGETVASWVWFMTQIKRALAGVDNLHIKVNLIAKFKDDTKTVEELFLKAAKAYCESYFNSIWAQLRAYLGVREYLDDIGKERWARCFQTQLRYTQMTTNIAESVNALFRHARKLPVTALLDHIRGKLQTWFYDRRTLAASRSTTLSDYAENMYAEYSDRARRHVDNIDQFHFQVQDGNLDGIVDLNAMTCSCQEFYYFKIPCSHAIAAATMRNINPYSLCDEAYTANSWILAYAEPIFPIRYISTWSSSPEFVNIPVEPPKTVPRVGRRKTARIPSMGEVRQICKCGRCGAWGHNRKTCSKPLTTL